jgi:hypothetical protein
MSIQKLYDEQRELKRRRQDVEDELTGLQEEIKKMENIDLVKQKKIFFKEVTFEAWLNDLEEETFWIFTTDCGRQMGIWEGLNELSDEDSKHFDQFEKDYFYYGGPNYVDQGDPEAECTECELAFEGDCSLTYLRRCDM